jgi:hypothetical protein
MTKTTKKNKPGRAVRLDKVEGCGRYLGRIVITDNGKRDDYLLERLDADFGAAYRLEKLCDEPVTYDVNLALGHGGHDSCECLGHLRWGHRTVCRHVAALLKLRERGAL